MSKRLAYAASAAGIGLPYTNLLGEPDAESYQATYTDPPPI